MSVDIQYGNFSFSGNLLPIPFVSRSQSVIYYGGKNGQVTSISLEGSVIGDFSDINDARNLILNAFSADFLSLKIKEDSLIKAEFQKCLIKDVTFSAANYGKANYSIELECYEQDLFFSQFFGVLDPKNEFSFTEMQNGTVEINHSISARGFLTTGQVTALTKAKDFVESLSGWYSATNVLPTLIAGINNSNIILTSVSKKIDTTNSSYSQEESYLAQTEILGNTPLILGVISEITASTSKDINNSFDTIDINYSIRGDKHVLPGALRGYIPSSGVLFNLAKEALDSVNVNPIPFSYKIQDEAEAKKKISVSASYNTDIIAEPGLAYLDYTVDFQTDHITEITTASISANIEVKGTALNKFILASGFLTSIIQSEEKVDGYLYNKVNEVYLKIYENSWSLKSIPQSLSISEDKNKGKISLNASFSNEDFVPGCSSAQYSLNVTPQLKKISASPGSNLKGLYGVFDLNTYNLEELSVNGNLVIINGQGAEEEIVNVIDGIYEAFVDSPNLTPQTTPILIRESASTGVYPNSTITFDNIYKIDRTKTWG